MYIGMDTYNQRLYCAAILIISLACGQSCYLKSVCTARGLNMQSKFMTTSIGL